MFQKITDFRLKNCARVDFKCSVGSETCPFLPQNHGAGCHNSSFLGRFPIDFKWEITYLII